MQDEIKGWLQHRVTTAEAERANMVQDRRLGPEPIPFGFINDRWRELLAGMRDGDELWEFRSPPETWDALMGWAGYAVIRQGEVVAIIEKEEN